MSEDIDWKAKLEEVQAERQAFEEHYKNAIIRLHVKLEAAEFWPVDPDLAAKLVDISGCRMDKDDIVHGVREAIQDLAARKPFLFAPKVNQGIAPPKRFGNDGFLEAVQRELGFKKFGNYAFKKAKIKGDIT
jgi:hypothetical protein